MAGIDERNAKLLHSVRRAKAASLSSDASVEAHIERRALISGVSAVRQVTRTASPKALTLASQSVTIDEKTSDGLFGALGSIF
jgi:hypothetical protein